MYLKRLELKGFKSFPNKTDIIFKEGITSIVGPNGSGKSNISDAVRWVLGEQSIKSLRGDKLEDVIFAGTNTKKPMNYCEVSLTIDNSDNKLDLEFSEVTIKRRAYRNGEGEFFINNKSCRLKDIKELLLDTGIGKDGYSIIEQGKVDEILSNNPINRRKVFDEACGISKFRYKKQEAEKNLKHTKENLDRINDIYIEIENQLKPLFNQQSKAKKYLELKESLKVIEVNNYIKEIENLNIELNEINKHKKLLEHESKEFNKQKTLIENSISEINKDIEDIDLNINKSQEFINTIKSVISQKDSQVSILNERIKNYKIDIEKKYIEIKETKEKLNNKATNSSELQKNYKENTEKVEKLYTNIKNIESNINFDKIEIEKLNESIENLKDDIINILNKNQEKNSKLSALNANYENIKAREKSIALDITNVNKQIYDKEHELKSTKEVYKLNNENINNLKIEEQKIKLNLNSLINNDNKISQEIQNNKYILNDFKSKLNIYIDMENHNEGFNKGVKEILKNKNIKGIHGALGQILEVDSKFEKAIESALGAYMQNIITSDENSAKIAINYLKKNNLGRVTFLPLNIIKPNKIDTKNIKSEIKFIGIASDLISYSSEYKNIFENILGRTIIIDNIDNGIKFAKETGHKFKVVTLDGEILNPGGSLTGGSFKTNTNILSRKRIINEYSEKIKTINVNVANLENKKEKSLKKIENTKNELNILEAKIKEFEKKLIIENSNINKVESEMNSLELNLEKLTKEKNGLDNNLIYVIEKIDIIKNEILDLENKHIDIKKNISKLTQNLRERTNLYESKKINYDNLNLELVKNKQIVQTLFNDIKRISDEDKELKLKLENINLELKNQEKESEKLKEEIIIEETEKESLNKQLIDNIKILENKKLSKEGLKNKLDELNNEFKGTNRKYIELKESLFKVQSRLERVKSINESYINQLFENYEMTLVQALEIKDEDIKIDKKILENIKREIRNLGNINIDSIKEYEEVKERYDFYSEQKQDLDQSIKAIESLIKDLEENMRVEFKSKFERINENFKIVYKRLFGGGNGELTIIDKENILESDIEITAQPPGKKMKNLNLLSGGEKALTAISILFSILLTKPTPFCILDEIEAPLDDANIYRFGEFLKELSKDTQFISVTHRRGTMEASDYIYGITMQEKAISKVLSLNIKEAKELTDII